MRSSVRGVFHKVAPYIENSGPAGNMAKRPAGRPCAGRNPAKPQVSRVGGAAVDRQGLAGDEVRFGRGEEDQRADKVLRHLVALQRPTLDRRLAGGGEVPGVLLD